jgi:hypothetical protein
VRGAIEGKILYLIKSIRNNFARVGWKVDVEGVKGRSMGGKKAMC